ncbi:MAG: tryptophan--tRNA ligase [Gammaproteobacteria bacterium]|nr:tryptophan--tRNA ligase [Gammaproteobacteria bacterium]
MSIESDQRVLSGMRPTGRMHLGHYHGALKNWVRLQHQYDCYFFVADYHALTTHYQDGVDIEEFTYDMVVDWLAVGLSPTASTIFVQSRVPEHAELHVLLSMVTPVGWLERTPTYKDQQANIADKDLSTYGFLGYPVLQAADVLVYRAGNVPVGGDQVAHLELAREIARRFNHIFGREPQFEAHAELAIAKMGKKAARLYRRDRTQYLEQGDTEALQRAQALLGGQQNLSTGDRDRLYGYLAGGGRIILPEPQALLTSAPVLPGLDGRKMSKSYNNAISLREEPDVVEEKVRTMVTDPARVRRTDPGDPEKCPVFALHAVYSDDDVKTWAADGCRRASIGCIDCKGPLIDAINREQVPIVERAKQFEDRDVVRDILLEGSEKARDEARETIDDVKAAVGMGQR